MKDILILFVYIILLLLTFTVTLQICRVVDNVYKYICVVVIGVISITLLTGITVVLLE